MTGYNQAIYCMYTTRDKELTFLSAVDCCRLKHKHLCVPVHTISHKDEFHYFFMYKISLNRKITLKYAPNHVLKLIFHSFIWGNVVAKEMQFMSSPLRQPMSKWAQPLRKCSIILDLVKKFFWCVYVAWGGVWGKKNNQKTPKTQIGIFTNVWCSAHLL